jgi:hypothetical protein
MLIDRVIDICGQTGIQESISVKNRFFTREICVCAHLTQTRYAQKDVRRNGD